VEKPRTLEILVCEPGNPLLKPGNPLLKSSFETWKSSFANLELFEILF
jgi:hypothetical protein